jgi:hypothetical protein
MPQEPYLRWLEEDFCPAVAEQLRVLSHGADLDGDVMTAVAGDGDAS